MLGKDWRPGSLAGHRVGLWHGRGFGVALVVDCSILEPCLFGKCACWGDVWSRVLVERARGLEEGGVGSYRRGPLAYPPAGDRVPLAPFGLGLVSSCVTSTSSTF